MFTTIRSKCCNSKVEVHGNLTLYHVCKKCGNACDIVFVERKVWERNPVTQVQPNKKKKSKIKLTKKEINQIRQEEDF